MVDLLATGADRLRTINRTHRARTVTYTRAVTSATVTATPGRTEFEVRDRYGFATRENWRDFIINAAALTAFGTPVRGDTITDTVNGEERVFAVAAPAGEQPYRDTDAYGTAYRIHVKQID